MSASSPRTFGIGQGLVTSSLQNAWKPWEGLQIWTGDPRVDIFKISSLMSAEAFSTCISSHLKCDGGAVPAFRILTSDKQLVWVESEHQ